MRIKDDLKLAWSLLRNDPVFWLFIGGMAVMFLAGVAVGLVLP